MWLTEAMVLLALVATIVLVAHADEGGSSVSEFQYRENLRGDAPKLLLFSKMKPAYVRDHAEL